ncbi:MAG: hypothetical protein V5A76_02010 [Candidatus Thermoplasmatota archaeon]
MKEIFEKFRDALGRFLPNIGKYPVLKVMLLIFLVWLIIYIPNAISSSYGEREDRYTFYPEEAAPWNQTDKNYDVTTEPISIENATGDRFVKNIEETDSTMEFNWTAHNYTSSHHIGRINVHYELDGDEGLIRLKNVYRNDTTRSWAAEKTFKREGNLTYYYTLEKNDISVFHRRTSVLLEGKNIYEEVRTGPPPLIHFYFIPPTLFTVAPEYGGAYLSFTLYFSLFVLFDALLIFSTFRKYGQSKAFLMSMLFLVNPITISNTHQDEAIVAFTIIIPLMYLIKKRDKTSSIFTGLSIPVKIWGGFIFPLYLLKKEYTWKRRFAYLVSAGSISVAIFLFFYYLWGANSVWFLSQYSGTTEAMNLGPLSFWGRWWGVFSTATKYPPRIPILLFVGISELAIFYIAYKREWPPLMTLASFLCLFFGLYIKVHWDYYLILFPFILYFSVRDRRLFFSFIGLVSTIYLMMIFASAPFDVSKLLMAFLNTTVVVILLYHVYLFITDEKFSEIEKKEIWKRGFDS